jgi:hypothetical protein
VRGFNAVQACEVRGDERHVAGSTVIQYVPLHCNEKRHQIFVIGDSHATAYLPMLQWGPARLRALDRESAAKDAAQWCVPFLDAGMKVVSKLPSQYSISRSCVASRSLTLCGRISEDRRDLEAYRAPVVQAMRSFVANHRDVHVWDPLPVLCPDERCNVVLDDRPMLSDGDHVSTFVNVVLLPSFRQALEPSK